LPGGKLRRCYGITKRGRPAFLEAQQKVHELFDELNED
jgi:hypothetical protein